MCYQGFLWSQRESNPYLKFRKLLFYPLNYETGISKSVTKVIKFSMSESKNTYKKHYPKSNCYLCSIKKGYFVKKASSGKSSYQMGEL